MPTPTQIPTLHLTIQTEPLTQELFSDYGTVIENPTDRIPSREHHVLPGVSANQGSAMKYVDVTNITNLYGSAPSGVEAKAVMNMFVCSPRDLDLHNDDDACHAAVSGLEGLFPVEILERHPFTSQTFIPIGLSKKEMLETCYLVIVAPSLPPSTHDELLPVPVLPPVGGGEEKKALLQLPGRGIPDLGRMRAFMAHGSQAVTYAAGTWHSPMVVLGKKAVDFVVVQYANGIEIEDCQEVILQAVAEDDRVGARGISVQIHQHSASRGLWKL